VTQTYLVAFERVGRNRNVAPLTADVDNGDQLAEIIYRYARPHLLSRDIEVCVDLNAGRGSITVGWNNGGSFTIAGVPFVNDEIGPRPGFVVGTCGHAVAGSEWRAGFRVCERCPSTAGGAS
jgi:hypothetical protein